MLKCVNGHAMEKGKFCGDCGGKAAEPEHATCGGCSGQMLKAQKFCSDCGTAAGPLEGDLEAAATEVGAFLKARDAIAKDLETLPTVEDDGTDVATMLKSILPTPDANTGDEPMDALPVVGAFLKAQNLLAARLDKYAGHIVRQGAQDAAGTALLLKAMGTVLGAVKGLREEVAELKGTPRGRKAVTVHAAHNGAGKTSELGIADVEPRPLMLKAQAARAANPSCLSLEDIGSLETYSNMGFGLARIGEEDAALAIRVDSALKSTTAAAH